MTQVSPDASALIQRLADLDEEIRGLLLWPGKVGMAPEQFQASLRALSSRRARAEEELAQLPTSEGDFALLRAG